MGRNGGLFGPLKGIDAFGKVRTLSSLRSQALTPANTD